MSEPETDEGEPDEDFEAPKKSTAGAGGTKKRKSVVGGDAANGGTQKKRGRPKKGSSPATGASKKPRARKKKADADGGDDAGEAEPKAKNGKDFPIEDDNDLFSKLQ